MQSPDEVQHAGDREAKSDQHEANDLLAQQKAADAAQASAVAANGQIVPVWLQVMFGFIGTILLIITAGYSIRTYNQTVVSNERQLRAYVGATACGIKPTPDGGKLVGGIKIKNFGQTPAHVTRIAAQVQIIPVSDEPALPPSFPDYRIHDQVFSLFMGDDDRTLESETDDADTPTITQALRQDLVEGRKAVRFFGIIFYRDIFGRERWTTFAKILIGKGTLISGDMRTDKLGRNDAS